MRSILLTFLIFLSCFADAKNYYVAANGNDANAGTSTGAPWKSITKVNAAFSGMAAGDSILFRRGDIFYGAIRVNKSGTSSSPIIISAYGTGARPVISGMTDVTGWTSAGTNLWKSSAIANVKAVNLVTVNDMITAKGRYPNADAASSGYLYFESVSGKTSITDNQLTSSPNWTGAEIVIKPNPWTISAFPISSHSGTTITFTGNSTSIRNNYGYFIQNSLLTLDQQNEWFFNVSTKQLTIYSSTTPVKVRVSTIDTLCYVNTRSYITIKGLEFQGANKEGISLSTTTGITIDDCKIANSGTNGIRARNSASPVVQNSSIISSCNLGISFDDINNSNALIKNNSLLKSGAIPGMGTAMNGISLTGNGHTVINNTIDSSGYAGIKFQRGSNTTIKNNVINTYCYVISDGGGIYTWNNYVPTATTYTNNKVIGNIILNGVGITDGTDGTIPDVDGIYMDDNTGNVDILDNTVSNVAGSGMYIHNNFNMNIRGNTLYNNGREQLNFTHNLAYVNGVLSPYTTPLRNITFKKNILFSKKSTQTIFSYYSLLNDLGSTGPTDSNYYSRPLDENVIIDATQNTSATAVSNTYNLDTWKSAYSKDAHTKKSPVPIPAYTISSLNTANLVSYGQFTSNISGITINSTNNNQSAAWDNTSKITGTGSLKLSFPSSVKGTYTNLYSAIGAASSSKTYVLRFTTLGTTSNGSLNVFIRKSASPYTQLASTQTHTFGTAKTVHEFIFKAPKSDAAASYLIAINQNSGTVYIDDIQFYEASVTSTNIDDYVRFEYNPTNAAKTISLGANYIGIDSTLYPGTLTLQPYTSKILFRDMSSGTVTKTATPPPVITAITVSGTTVPISCFGGSTTNTISATGGTAPYTGTGSFKASAGTGSLKLSFTSPVAGTYTKLYSTVGSLDSTKTYVLKFSTLGTTANGSLRAAIRLTNSPWSNISALQTAKFGTSRTDHQFVFTGLTAQSVGSFLIEIDQASGTTYIDNIAFFEATSTGTLLGNNLFPSGQFLSNIDGVIAWSSTTNHTITWDNTSKINDIYYYTVTDASGSSGVAGVNTVQPSSALKVTASAPAITVKGGSSTVTVSATGGTAPYTGTGTFSKVLAGTYTYTVTDAKGCTASSTITITQPAARPMAATSTTPTTTDATISADVSTVPVSTELKVSAYPNPTSANFNLIVEGGTGEKINIAAYSIDGRMIYQATGNTKQKFILGDDFKAGMYILRVTQGNNTQTLKLVKGQ